MNIYISPSTQDWNKGVNDYGTEEQRMNQIADHLVPLLKYNGFVVYRNRPEMKLEQVVKDSNAKIGSNGLHVAIHSNAGGGKGTEIWFYTGSVVGKHLAESVYSEVAPLTPSSDRGVKSNKDYRELNGTQSVAVILEVAFHDNVDDARFIVDHLKEIARGIAKGICKHVGLPYQEQSTKIVNTQKVNVITGWFNEGSQGLQELENYLKSKGFYYRKENI